MPFDMKRENIIRVAAVAGFLAAVSVGGCSRMSTEELRLSGIEQLENGDYEAASKSFAEALEAWHSREGKVYLQTNERYSSALYPFSGVFAAISFSIF